MFLVPTYVAQSPIHGLGVYAAAPIAKGTLIWRFQDGVDQVIPEAVVASLPQAARDFLDFYCYRSPLFGRGYVLNFDHARFLNHSDQPNTDNSTEVTYAARDIAAGEEITCSYDDCCVGYEFQPSAAEQAG